MNLLKVSHIYQLLFILIFIAEISPYFAKTNVQKSVLEDVTDIKEFKKLLRTKNNLLVCYVSSIKQASNVIKIFKESAQIIKGQGTMLIVDCSGEAKKMCKKFKVSPKPHILKHYKDGDFHKDYDRLLTVQSMVNFMRDPTGDIPWEEDSTAIDVVHLSDPDALSKLIRREELPILVMFYAPWCGFCKQLKPDFSGAATELRGHSVFAAIDVNRPENTAVRHLFNITGFPTLIYFKNGLQKLIYEGENNKLGLIEFMKNPKKSPEKPQDVAWSATVSDVVHLTAENFDSQIKTQNSILVMFYAPWCGHCKKMKPEYEQAAEALRNENIKGVLAAVDATRENMLASRYKVKGYPTIKYFRNGEFAWDANHLRDSEKLVEFMKDPREPPPPPPPEVSWSEEPSEVVHLAEATFKPFLKKKKHVLIMFYAPWCGHCKKAKPEFTAAAEKFKDDPKVEFAAVDCTKNEVICQLMEIKGYPTIYYTSYLKEHSQYTGGRTETDFVRFMSETSSSISQITSGTLPIMDTDVFDKQLQTGKWMFVLFYAQWCAHCKTLIPIFEKAAEELQAENIPIFMGMVDVSENEPLQDRYDISSIPSLKLFYNREFFLNYDSPRTLDDIKSFVKNSLLKKDEL